MAFLKNHLLFGVNTLVEMWRILYAPDRLQCPSFILRLYNLRYYTINYTLNLVQELIQKANKLRRRKLIVWCLFS